MNNIHEIVYLNKRANIAIRERNLELAATYLCMIHKIEHHDRCGLGMYRFKNI